MNISIVKKSTAKPRLKLFATQGILINCFH